MAAGDFQLALSLLLLVSSLLIVSGKEEVCDPARDFSGLNRTLTCPSSWQQCCTGFEDLDDISYTSRSHCCFASKVKWYIAGAVGGLIVLAVIGSFVGNKCGLFDQFQGHRRRNGGRGNVSGLGGNRNLGLVVAANAAQNSNNVSTGAGAGIPLQQGPPGQQAAYPQAVAYPGQVAQYPGQQMAYPGQQPQQMAYPGQQPQQMAYPGQQPQQMAPGYGAPQAGYPAGNPSPYPPGQDGYPQGQPGMKPDDSYPTKPGQEPYPTQPGPAPGPGQAPYPQPGPAPGPGQAPYPQPGPAPGPGQAPYPQPGPGPAPPSYNQAVTY